MGIKKGFSGDQNKLDWKDHPWETETMGEKEEVESQIRNTVYTRIEECNARNLLFKRLAVAALVLITLSFGVYLLKPNISPYKLAQGKLPGTAEKAVDIMPGGNKAMLMLADGSQIDLEALEKGQLKDESKPFLNKVKEGQVHFLPRAGVAAHQRLHTLITPRGGKYSIILPDGTKVWLNAASSLRFPDSFNGKDRKVYLTGEGYFEVAKNKRKPFKVYINNLEIKVLGTHFNVMGYSNEEVIKTTLLEGSVKISDGKSANLLKPGQAASQSRNGSINIQEANVDRATAWKQDQFIFDKVDIQTIMRELSRWYDVEVAYQGEIPNNQFVGKISRNATLSQVLRVLELSRTHFKMEGRKIIILP